MAAAAADALPPPAVAVGAASASRNSGRPPRAAHDRRARGGMADRVAAIGIARLDRAHLLDERFELAAPDVLEVRSLRPPRRGLVEIDRDAQAAPDLAGDALGEAHAFFDGHALD